MAVNVVRLANGETVIDLSGDTVYAGAMLEGITAHGADGEPIIGTAKPGIDTSDATAAAGDIAYQKTAYVNGQKITGTLTDGSFNATTSNVSTAMGGAFVRLSATAAEDQIVRAGDPINLNTLRSNFGDATAEDVAEGKTFTSAAGLKVVGTNPGTVIYTPLAYLEASGEQYIDTGISGGVNAAYEIKFSSCGSVASDWNHYFAGDGKDTSAARIQAIGSAHVIGYWANSANYYWLWNMADAEAHIVRYDGTGAMYVDGVAASYGADTSGFAGNGWGDLSWYVFNSHNEPTTKAKMRLYYLKMYTDGVLVRDFIPVQRSIDGAYGLYDLVTEQFFGNIGTGEFAGVAQSEYESAAMTEYTEALQILGVSV